MECNGIEWEWNRMEWNGTEWNISHFYKIEYPYTPDTDTLVLSKWYLS